MPRPRRRAENLVVKVSKYTSSGLRLINFILSIQITIEKFAAGRVNSTSNFTQKTDIVKQRIFLESHSDKGKPNYWAEPNILYIFRTTSWRKQCFTFYNLQRKKKLKVQIKIRSRQKGKDLIEKFLHSIKLKYPFLLPYNFAKYASTVNN